MQSYPDLWPLTSDPCSWRWCSSSAATSPTRCDRWRWRSRGSTACWRSTSCRSVQNTQCSLFTVFISVDSSDLESRLWLQFTQHLYFNYVYLSLSFSLIQQSDLSPHKHSVFLVIYYSSIVDKSDALFCVFGLFCTNNPSCNRIPPLLLFLNLPLFF